MNEFISLKIDNKSVRCKKGSSILEAALMAGIYIPHLCHHPNLPHHEACKLCVVEMQEQGTIVASCSTKAEAGMELVTNSPAVQKIRNLSIELIFSEHPADCTACPKYLKCELQSVAQFMGLRGGRLKTVGKNISSDMRNPLFVRDMNRCIQCGRCVRACEQVRGVKVLDYCHTEVGSSIGIPGNKLMGEAGCRFCGACVEVCPTGSLRDKEGIINDTVPYEQALVPCQQKCPAHIDIPRYIRKLAKGEMEDAVAVICEKVPFPETLGLICNHACEDVCRRGLVNQPVSICSLKRYAANYDSGSWKKRRIVKPQTKKRVAVIGAGPAGLTAAYYLVKQGHQVVIFERKDLAGGMLQFGIPKYRLSEDIVQREIRDILDIGIEIKYETNITNPKRLLTEGFDAVIAATGAQCGSALQIPGYRSEGVLTAIDILEATARKADIKTGERVFIIGGGNVAFDCARTLRRRGCERIDLACLENRECMQASAEEVAEALEEGIRVHPCKTFIRIVTDGKHVTGVETANVDSFSFDENNKLQMKIAAGENHIYECDTVIFAVGQKSETFDDLCGFTVGKANTLVTEANSCQLLGSDAIFAAGDITTGTKFVISAIAAGRAAAMEVDQFLGGQGDIDELLLDRDEQEHFIGRIAGFDKLERASEELLPVSERISGFKQTTKAYPDKTATAEAVRCLQCDLRRDLERVKFWNSYDAEPAEE